MSNNGSMRGPTLRRHKRSGHAYAKFDGAQRWFGPYDDRATHARFAAFKARWEANGRVLPVKADTERSPYTVAELRDDYLAHLRRRHDQRWAANNLTRVELALEPLRDQYGGEPVAAFSPLRLQAVRQAMISGGRLCRREINDRVRVILVTGTGRAFWAVAQERAPASLAHALAAVEPIRAGEYGTREGRRVGPVDERTVWATLPYLSRPAAALVELLWWTGARPSELLGLCPRDLDRSGVVWEVRLPQHKTARHGKRRAIYFGEHAQAVLQRFLNRVPPPAETKPMFSPAEAVAELRKRRRSARTTPLYRSHVDRYERQRKADPERQAGDRYTASALRIAVARAVRACNRDRVDLGEEPIPAWTPYQLRHAAATRLRREHGLEVVRCVLGHSSAEKSEVYAEADLLKARQAMESAG